jgi:dihydroorotate dehydrogenase electron transfer subunit
MEGFKLTIDRLLGNPDSVRISEIIKETDDMTTLLFQHPMDGLTIEPGQFLMIWIAGVDEIPMSVSYWDPPIAGITVLPIGDATSALSGLRVGEWVGIRGPFGKAFTLNSKRALVVGGGIGTAPLRPLVYSLLNRGSEVTFLIAAKSKNALLFLDEFTKNPIDGLTVETATDDGSAGYKGLATGAARVLLGDKKFDALYTCGPELMMAGLHELAQKEGLYFEASLERYMKCGCGICGTCALDPTGDLVCVDGPVYSGEKLLELTDFGKHDRDAVGIKRRIG